MIEIEDNEILITKENGEEEVFKILFYYNNPERNKDFYFLFKDENPDEIIAMASENGQELMELTEEEFEEAQEMLDTFEQDPKIAGIK